MSLYSFALVVFFASLGFALLGFLANAFTVVAGFSAIACALLVLTDR